MCVTRQQQAGRAPKRCGIHERRCICAPSGRPSASPARRSGCSMADASKTATTPSSAASGVTHTGLIDGTAGARTQLNSLKKRERTTYMWAGNLAHKHTKTLEGPRNATGVRSNAGIRNAAGISGQTAINPASLGARCVHCPIRGCAAQGGLENPSRGRLGGATCSAAPCPRSP
jgi:hypothetical protein